MNERWFHGGYPGLKEGAMLLPPDETGKPTNLRYAEGIVGNTQRGDRVYLTRDQKIAELYAGVFPKGDVYEAEPVNPEPDTDCLEPGLSIQCERAKIVRIVRRRCPLPAFVVEANSRGKRRR